MRLILTSPDAASASHEHRRALLLDDEAPLVERHLRYLFHVGGAVGAHEAVLPCLAIDLFRDNAAELPLPASANGVARMRKPLCSSVTPAAPILPAPPAKSFFRKDMAISRKDTAPLPQFTSQV